MSSNENILSKTWVLILMIIFSFVLIRMSWVSDDAYITFRTIDNFVHGYGLVWNIGEKVQTYTNPLWMFLLTIPYFFSHEIYFTVIAISILLTLITIYWLLFKLQPETPIRLVTASILLLSQAFIDYSTSGLENVLTHCFIVIFVWTYFNYQASANRRVLLLSLLASLCMVNRLDTGLLFLPILFIETFGQFTWQKLAMKILGMVPILAWETLAFLYYGFWFPNTYYAKLHTGIPLIQLIFQGCIYVLDSIKNDPITLTTIVVSITVGLWAMNKKRSDSIQNSEFRVPNLIYLSLGSFLYILYVIKNGGDFMSGRFFSAPFILAIASIQPFLTMLYQHATKIFKSSAYVLPISGIVFIVAVVWQFSAPLNKEPTIPLSGIVDERAFHFQSNGLVNLLRSDTIPPHPWAQFGKAQKEEAEKVTGKRYVAVFPNVGMLGFFAGPKVYIIDPLGLTDPFLARQTIDLNQPWRVGHYLRSLPAGYIETKEQNRNLIQDPELAKKYDEIESMITKLVLK